MILKEVFVGKYGLLFHLHSNHQLDERLRQQLVLRLVYGSQGSRTHQHTRKLSGEKPLGSLHH